LADRGVPAPAGSTAQLGDVLPKADSRRIARFLDEVSQVGRDSRGGWSRLAFSTEERAAHEIFSRWAGELGLEIAGDPIGNSFADLGGTTEGPKLVTGSHLDTVPRGGNFDGAVGVAAALEVARIFSEARCLQHGFRALVFSAEESVRFGAPCIGSRVATGAFTAGTLRQLVSRDGRSAADCAREVGLEPDRVQDAVWPDGSVAAFLELHIEQGCVLESRGRDLGIVDAIGGSTRLSLIFPGRADHSGATPMDLRRDALVAAGEFVVEVERQAMLHPTTVATVGQFTVAPNSLTTVPGLVELSLDVRDVDSEMQRDTAEDLLDAAARIAGRRGIAVSASLLSDQSPIVLHRSVRECLAQAAIALGASFSVLRSGATHDAAHVARCAPAGMVFIPSREGVSHAPAEWSSVEDAARGADVMASAFLALDERIA
jgi:allantoate deiminase